MSKILYLRKIMKVQDIIDALERQAPLNIQEGFDNSGLQAGLAQSEVRSVLVCLDVTEAVVDEALEKGCELIVSHHPLLFHPLKCLSDRTYQQRCLFKAVKAGLGIYSSHTSLDNARGGVNFKIAELIGLQDCSFLSPIEGKDAGSGLIGSLPQPEDTAVFLQRLKTIFGVHTLRHSAIVVDKVQKIALCGGAGAFLMPQAQSLGADCFITGELHYHDYFEAGNLVAVALGHYESEQFTMDLLCARLKAEFPELEVIKTHTNTNAVISL